MTSVYIPETISEIEADIAYKNEQLVWWLDKLNRSRKNSLRHMRSMQVDSVREQIELLEDALLSAQEKALNNIA